MTKSVIACTLRFVEAQGIAHHRIGLRQVVFILLSCIFTGCETLEEDVTSCELGSFQCEKMMENSDGEEIIAVQEKMKLSAHLDHDLDLYELLDLAFKNNPLTKVAWSQAKVASAQKTKADSAFFPKVNASLTGARVEQMGGVSQDGQHLTTSVSNVVYPQVDITYSLFKFGAHKAISRAAQNTLEALNFQFNQTLQDVACIVELAYFSFDSALAIVDANEKNLEDVRVALDVAKDRHQSGLANKQDVLKAQAAYSAALFDLENSRSAVESARANLAKAIGIQVTDDLQIAKADIGALPDVDNVEHIISEAVKSRQDVWSKKRMLDAKKCNWDAKVYDQYPEVILGVSASRKKFKNISGMYNNFEAFAGVRWEIFDGHAKTAERLMAREEVKIADQQLRSQILDVTAQVWEHFYAFKSAIHKLDSAKESENCALESFNYAKEAYANGLSSFTDLLTSQNALSLARKQLVCAKNDLSIEWMQLAYSTGKILEK